MRIHMHAYIHACLALLVSIVLNRTCIRVPMGLSSQKMFWCRLYYICIGTAGASIGLSFVLEGSTLMREPCNP